MDRDTALLNNLTGSEKLKAWQDLPLEEKRAQLARRRKERIEMYDLHIFEGLTVQEIAERYNTNKTVVNMQIAKRANWLAKRRDYDIPAERMQQYHQLKELMASCYKRSLEGNDFAIKSYVSLASR